MILTCKDYLLMLEALRRYHIHPEEKAQRGITNCWLGLGCPGSFRHAVESGLFKPLHAEKPHIMGWYLLTKLGAHILQSWITAGFGFEHATKTWQRGFDHSSRSLKIHAREGRLPPMEVDGIPQALES